MKNYSAKQVFFFEFSSGHLITKDIAMQFGVLKFDSEQPPVVFYKKGVLKKFAKFTEEHLCQSLFFNKVPALSRLLFFTGGLKI